MDDQKQTNQPLDQTAPPVAPSVPEDITPVETPIAPAVDTTPIAPVAEPITPPVPMTSPDLAPPSTPWPVAEPIDVPPQTESLPPLAEPSMDVPPTPTPSEPPMAEIKPKNKIMPIVGGVLALLLVVGVAGAAYYVSNQLSTRQAVAPTAPESKPLASGQCSIDHPATGFPEGYNTQLYLDCGTQCCTKATDKCTCMNGCVPKDGPDYPCPTGPSLKCPETACYHYPTEVAPEDDCNVCSPDRSFLSNVTFATAGSVRIHQEGMIDPGTTITLTKGTETISATKVSNGNYDATVTAGTYKVTVKLGFATEGGQASLGFIRPDANKCGRYDPTNKRDVTTYSSAASLTGFGISTITGVDIPVQCWADRIQGTDDDTRGQLDANYDFNDFNLIIGYKAAQEVAACTDVRVYKVGETTKLTSEQLSNLKIGDNLRLELTSNMDNLKGRFAVKIGQGTPEYLAGTIDATNKKLVKSTNYAISANGAYSLQGEVSTTPTSTEWVTATAVCTTTGLVSTSTVGACVNIEVLRKNTVSSGWDLLTSADTAALKVGDELLFRINGNLDNLDGRFRVTVNSVAGNWLTGVRGDGNIISYSPYIVATAGTYKLEAQVTTKQTN